MTLDRPARLILVEDNPADANLVEEALAEAQVDCGLQILTDGTKAVEFIGNVERDELPAPDLVMLDLNLPRMGGEEVLRRMRNSRKFDSVQVLVVTSSNAASDRDLVMKLGATDYFRKPSTLEQYLALGPKIRQMLQRDFLSAV